MYSYLPFMVLPLYAALERWTRRCSKPPPISAARAGSAFWRVTVPLSLPGIAAGALLCFIPIVGEFVIPDLLGGSQTLMIGQTLWTEFFSNRDWPVASAIAVLLLILLVVPIVFYRAPAAARARRRGVMRGTSAFNVVSVALGLAFLYLPIAILVIYSFNASRLVDGVGRLVARLVSRAAAATARCWMPPGSSLRIAFLSATAATVLGTSRRSRWCGRPLPRAAAVLRHGLCAAGDAGSDHRARAATAVRRAQYRPRLLDHRRSRTPR